MEAFTSSSHCSFRRLPTPQFASTTTPGPETSIAPPPESQSLLQQRLQTLIEGARERWIYAIFWQAYDYSSGASRLRWGHGYYKGEDDKAHKTTSSAEQDHRKKVLREIYSLISADDVDEEVTDTAWFFLLSMTQSFANGSSLPGLAFFNWTPVWVTGPGRLSDLACERAQQGQVLGLQTLVCIPCANGVVELGSTEMILPNPDQMNRVLDLFDADFNNNKVREGIKDMVDFIYPIGLPGLLVVDEHHPPLQPREESHESAVNEMQNHGKEKLSDSKCSWPLLTESSDRGTDRTLSNSHNYSGPS